MWMSNQLEQASFAAKFHQEFKGMFTKHKTLVRAVGPTKSIKCFPVAGGIDRSLLWSCAATSPNSIAAGYLSPTTRKSLPHESPNGLEQWSDCEFVKSSQTFWVIFCDTIMKKFYPLWNWPDRATIWKSEWICEFLGICMRSEKAGFQAEVGIFEKKQGSESFWENAVLKSLWGAFNYFCSELSVLLKWLRRPLNHSDVSEAPVRLCYGVWNGSASDTASLLCLTCRYPVKPGSWENQCNLIVHHTPASYGHEMWV